MRTKLLIPAAVIAAAIGLIGAQQRQAPLSPPAETSVTIDGKMISIKYSAPSMRGRKIFGGLEPYGKVWRAGANAATAFHTDADIDLGGLAVPKGDYTLYVWLAEDQWELIVNKQTGQWGTRYDQQMDLGRVKMKMSKPPAPIETFKITLSEAGAHAGNLEMAWENTTASVPFTVK
ncbi:MAG: DUF2911 domain-containing protein [Acidobacteria bacterium]|nr:MAG: DUF2911 domain-containing protein [Acidobacteriota bacterium]